MYKENYLHKRYGFYTSSSFGEFRDWKGLVNPYYHSGIDKTNDNYKKTKIKNCLNGLLYAVKSDHKYHGRAVYLEHNPKYVGGVDEKLFSIFAHLSKINSSIINKLKYSSSSKRFVTAGTVIGNMGNTGDCWSEGQRVSKEQQNDPKSRAGVHLHYEFFQKKVKKGKITKLMAHMIDLKLLEVDSKNILKEDNSKFIYQWGNVYFSYALIFKYFKKLQENIKEI